MVYNPHYGDGRVCKCGHRYYRHFDSYENNAAGGCKYCSCSTFEEAELDSRPLMVAGEDIIWSATPYIGKVYTKNLSGDSECIGVVFPLEYVDELRGMALRLTSAMQEHPELENHKELLDNFLDIAKSASGR